MQKTGNPNATRSSMTIAVPRDFNFWRTAYSHGWCSLVPFTFDPASRVLSRVFTTSDGVIVSATIRDGEGRLAVTLESWSKLTSANRAELRGQILTCLRLEEDFSAFHALAGRYPEFRWMKSTRSGRLLRAPTVFEDAVKTLCTTNCSWALTENMVNNLVRLAGPGTDGGPRGFPAPEALAVLSERDLRTHFKLGYRAPYLREFATKAASGDLGIERWRSVEVPREEIDAHLKSLKGFGPYAAGNLLRLLGRYDSLALDSWVRSQFYRLHTRGRKVSDARIEKHYASYGEWRGLVFWLEMTRYWHDDKFTRGE
jgi:N-glycosylase/DNA lyase